MMLHYNLSAIIILDVKILNEDHFILYLSVCLLG